MFATDFLFDGQRLSDMGYIIACIDGSSESVSGGNIEFNSVKPANSDRYKFYNANFNEVLTWTFTIMKSRCYFSDDNLYITQRDESQLTKWLIKTDGYKYIQFLQDDYEDVVYNVYNNMTPVQIGGRTIGFTITSTSDCGYGFTPEITKVFSISVDKPYMINIYNDTRNVCYPTFNIQPSESEFTIKNESENTEKGLHIKNHNMGMSYHIDTENEIIEGISNPDDFNWHFVRLVDGENIISTDATFDIEVEMTYRETRKVIV